MMAIIKSSIQHEAATVAAFGVTEMTYSLNYNPTKRVTNEDDWPAICFFQLPVINDYFYTRQFWPLACRCSVEEDSYLHLYQHAVEL
jgi:hypothetical protein